jgi:putative copper export protein/peroxiredoxin
MRALLLGALWIHLASGVLLVGAFAMLLLAGQPRVLTARRWDQRLVAWARALVVVALGSGVVWLLVRTAVFENRPQAAFEPRAIAHVMVDTWPGLVWLARHGLLIVLGAFVAIRASVDERRNWIAARGEALLLASLALALVSASSHAAAISPGTAPSVAGDVTHLLATGVWLGGLVALIPLLRAAARDEGADARPYAVIAARRFSRVALIAMLLLLGSGVTNALAQVESIPALAGTTHGRLLLAKLAMLLPILGVAIVNRTRVLPAVAAPNGMRRLAIFVGVEAGLALVLVALAAAMTLTTPARHAAPVWPLPFRLSLDELLEAPARWRALVGSQLAAAGVVGLATALLVRRGRLLVLGGAIALVAIGAGVGLPPLVVDAYPTSYRRPLLTYHAASIASGVTVYRERCAGCHDARWLTSRSISRRHAGELFWLVSRGIPERGMPGFDTRLTEAQRWDVINYIRAAGAAEASTSLGGRIEAERAWMIAPDFTVAVGPLAPGALRDYRGRRMVLVVLYTLLGSRGRLAELARMYDVLWVMGVEIIAVPTQASPEAIAELGASPPILFPVVTDGAREIVAAYGMVAPGPHAEILIDRQGYVRAIWRGEGGAVQAQVEKLNAEKSPPPFPDDHVH